MTHLPELGKLIDPAQPLPLRDAVHVAIVPCVAGEILIAGDSVKLVDGKAYRAWTKDGIGVADPWLGGTCVYSGQTFWLLLNPGSITSLRHDWTHPAFDLQPPVQQDDAGKFASVAASDEKAEAWGRIHAYAKKLSAESAYYSEVVSEISGERLVAAAGEGAYEDGDDYLPFDSPDDVPEQFWEDYEIVTGKAPEGRYFRCAC